MGPRSSPDLPSFVDFNRIVGNTPPCSGYCDLGAEPIGDEHPVLGRHQLVHGLPPDQYDSRSPERGCPLDGVLARLGIFRSLHKPELVRYYPADLVWRRASASPYTWFATMSAPSALQIAAT